MQTQIYTYDTLYQAAKTLQEGGLVAFPTETVYGLGAMANNSEAVGKVFKAKGRPQDNPLIVHLAKPEDAKLVASSVSAMAERLMEAFWPGPLTIILPVKPGAVSDKVTGGLDSVALRMPRQLETLLLIEMAGFPLVGPSANLSGKPSPTKVEHVLHDFTNLIDGVVAAREELTEIGVESTVIRPSERQIEILRPGAITQSMLEAVVDVPVIERTAQEQVTSGQIISPGVKYRHYAPKQPVYQVAAQHTLDDWCEIIAELQAKGEVIGLLADDIIIEQLASQAGIKACYSLGAANSPSQASQRLYAGLRALEEQPITLILAQGMPFEEAYQAYENRLAKASYRVI
ncbi:threonylcarbamoyl-AMP synthase [Suicoccus acidiformans]|uniref:Threonylcarbamoyl-AMP synthase n=1 Tax=Suicoccus acidiformans TaxID=2036206 RepID=A0A347WLM9_9LACT|nr:L-threonylcarbamoyladenylate synthase [Suicoccus acidiformans]AXY25986.1 threonylcarbamoyl-AMP synthase [Suicoccus acidiformans]